jgi:hypothetical protein
MISEHMEQELVLLSLSISRLAFLATPTHVRSRAFRYAVMKENGHRFEHNTDGSTEGLSV